MSDRFYLERLNDYDYRMALHDRDSKYPEDPIAFDGGEPEDNTFYRDWSWVVPLLNKLNSEIEELKEAELERVRYESKNVSN